jgi:hypothetical protein
MRYRYADSSSQGELHVKVLILLAFINMVPVVGLEPTRRFKVPGF